MPRYWTHRLVQKGVAHEALEKRFGESVSPFKDPDGLMLALVGVAGAETEPAWHTGDTPAEHAIRGFHGVALLLEDASPTAAVLTDVLGFNKVGQEEALIRFRASEQVIPDALQKAKKWTTSVEVADNSWLQIRLNGRSVRSLKPGSF
jgi:glyoxalase family protein